MLYIISFILLLYRLLIAVLVVSSRIADLLRSGRIHRVNRLIISSTKKTRDLQLLVEEQKHGVSYDGRRFVASDMLAFFVRLGVRTYVMRHPEDATPAMRDIASKGPGTDKILARRFEVTLMRSRNPLPDDNSVVPKWGFYRKKKINGKDLKQAYHDGIIDYDDLMEFYLDALVLRADILDDKLLLKTIKTNPRFADAVRYELEFRISRARLLREISPKE